MNPTAGLIFASILLLAILAILVVFVPVVGTVLVWLYVIGLIVATLFTVVGLWLMARGRTDTRTAIILSQWLISITGNVKSVRIVIATLLELLNVLILWPIEALVMIWRYMHSSIVATEMQRQMGHTLIYPLYFIKTLILLLITVLFFVFDAPTYTIVVCGASAVLWLIIQTVSPSDLLSELRHSMGSVYARLWLIAAAQIAILVLFFVRLALNEDASLNPIDLIRANFVELLVSPKDFIVAVSETSVTAIELLKIGAGLLMYSTLISLLFRKANFTRSDEDWITLATGQLVVGQPERALRLLQKVKNKGSQELAVRASGFLMLARFDEALKTINVLHSVLEDKEESFDCYAEAAIMLVKAGSDAELRSKFIRYWLEKGQPSDAMLASVMLTFTNIASQDPSDLSVLLPENSFPLTRALLHINNVIAVKLEPDLDLIEATLNAQYADTYDRALCDLVGVSLQVGGIFEFEKPPTERLDGVIGYVEKLTPQQCIFLYDNTLGLTWAVADEPAHSDLRARVLELKDSLLSRLTPDEAERVRSMESRMSQHFREKLKAIKSR